MKGRTPPRDPTEVARIEKQMRLEDRAWIVTLLALSAIVVIALILQFGGRSNAFLIAGLVSAMGVTLIAAVVWVVAFVRSSKSLDSFDPAGRPPRRPLWAYIVPFGAGLLAAGFYWAFPAWRQWTWEAFVVGGFAVWAWFLIKRRRRASSRK